MDIISCQRGCDICAGVFSTKEAQQDASDAMQKIQNSHKETVKSFQGHLGKIEELQWKYIVRKKLEGGCLQFLLPVLEKIASTAQMVFGVNKTAIQQEKKQFERDKETLTQENTKYRSLKKKWLEDKNTKLQEPFQQQKEQNDLSSPLNPLLTEKQQTSQVLGNSNYDKVKQEEKEKSQTGCSDQQETISDINSFTQVDLENKIVNNVISMKTITANNCNKLGTLFSLETINVTNCQELQSAKSTGQDILLKGCNKVDEAVAKGNIIAERCTLRSVVASQGYVELNYSVVSEKVVSGSNKESPKIGQSIINGTLECSAKTIRIQGSHIKKIKINPPSSGNDEAKNFGNGGIYDSVESKTPFSSGSGFQGVYFNTGNHNDGKKTPVSDDVKGSPYVVLESSTAIEVEFIGTSGIVFLEGDSKCTTVINGDIQRK